MGRHRGKLLRELFLVFVINFDATGIRQHFHHCRADFGEWNITAGHGQRR